MRQKSSETFTLPKKIHFIGIAGAGMSSLAMYLACAGYEVSGSDCRDSEIMDEFRKRGLRVSCTQVAENIADAELVAYSTAVPKHNLELIEAKSRNIAIERGELLARISNTHKNSVAVCGTHGKGTTAGALVAICKAANMKTSYILGAPIKGEKFPSHFEQEAEILICEVDESDRTHRFHRPNYLLINNVEADHLNVYKNLEHIAESFSQLIKDCLRVGSKVLLQADGVGAPLLLETLDDNNSLYLAKWQKEDEQRENAFEGKHFAFNAKNIEEIENGRFQFDVFFENNPKFSLSPQLGGIANAHNFFSAASLAWLMNIDIQAIEAGTERYPGLVDRCQHVRNPKNQISLVTDYASHPTCMHYDILWQKQYQQRIIAVFQPFRYSLAAHHWEGLIKSLALADVTVLAPLDGAGEEPVEGISSEILAEKLRNLGKQANAFQSFDDLESYLMEITKPNDCIIIFGGGSIFELGRRVLYKKETVSLGKV